MASPSRFSTSRYPAAQRTEIWRDYLSEELFVADYRALSADGIVSEHASMEVAAGRMHSFASNEHIVDLTVPEAHAPSTGGTAPIMYFTTLLSGRAMYWSNSRMEIATPGETLVYNPADPFFMSFHDDTRLLMFESRGGAFPLAEEWAGRSCMRVRTDFGRRVQRDILGRVYAGLQHGLHTNLQFAHEVEGLLATLEHTAREALTPGHFSVAVEVIEARLGDPAFSVRELASAVHLSERQLTRVFEERGTTPGRYIIEARMRFAEELLAAGDRTIREVAAACGAGSASHFSRTFTKYTGQTPSAYRAGHRTEA